MEASGVIPDHTPSSTSPVPHEHAETAANFARDPRLVLQTTWDGKSKVRSFNMETNITFVNLDLTCTSLQAHDARMRKRMDAELDPNKTSGSLDEMGG